MASESRAMAGCLYLGEYIDECPPTGMLAGEGDAVRPQLVPEFVDVWASDDKIVEFTVLLKDGRAVVVRGQALKYAPHPIAGQDVYSIVIHDQGVDVLVAIFKSSDVAGVFQGEIRSDRKIA